MATKNHPKMKAAASARHALCMERLQRVIELKAAGRKQFEIAKELGITDGRVSQLLQEAREIARERAVQTADEFLREEIEQLDVLRRQLFRAWERSQEDGEQIEKTKNKEGKLVVSKRTRKGQAGDASLAGQLIKVHERICKLKGLDVERVKVDGDFRVAGRSVEETDGLMLERLRTLRGERGSKGNGD